MKILGIQNGNKKLILAAVLLHDIVKSTNGKNSADASAKLSEKILEKNSFSNDEI